MKMTESVSAALSVELITTTRDDLVDISRLLARALDPDLLRMDGQPIVFAVNGSHSSGKKIFPDIISEEVIGEREMIFSGRKGFDEFYFDPSEEGLQVSYIDLAYGYGYETESLRKPGLESAASLMDAFMKVGGRHGGLSLMQNNRHDLPAANVWLEDGLRDPTKNPLGIAELGQAGSEDITEAFSAARNSIEDRKWVRRVRLDITDPRLLQSPGMQYAIETLTQQANEVRHLLVEQKVAASDLPARPYASPPQAKI